MGEDARTKGQDHVLVTNLPPVTSAAVGFGVGRDDRPRRNVNPAPEHQSFKATTLKSSNVRTS